MGADLTVENAREEGGEPVADLRARYSPDMKGIEVPPERAASMIDEFPILSVVAAFAMGQTMMRGVRELRVKESDRIDAMAEGTARQRCRRSRRRRTVSGDRRTAPGAVPGGVTCAGCTLDHRIAMSFLVLGMATLQPVRVDDGEPDRHVLSDLRAADAGLGAELTRDAG